MTDQWSVLIQYLDYALVNAKVSGIFVIFVKSPFLQCDDYAITFQQFTVKENLVVIRVILSLVVIIAVFLVVFKPIWNDMKNPTFRMLNTNVIFVQKNSSSRNPWNTMLNLFMKDPMLKVLVKELDTIVIHVTNLSIEIAIKSSTNVKSKL